MTVTGGTLGLRASKSNQRIGHRDRSLTSTHMHDIAACGTRDGVSDAGVCGKNTPPDKKTGWKISFENTESGAGLQFLLLGRMAKAHVQ